MSDNELLSPAGLAGYLHIPIGTIYGWNYRGVGPRKYKVGKHVRYRLADVEAWLERHSDGAGSAA